MLLSSERYLCECFPGSANQPPINSEESSLPVFCGHSHRALAGVNAVAASESLLPVFCGHAHRALEVVNVVAAGSCV